MTSSKECKDDEKLAEAIKRSGVGVIDSWETCGESDGTESGGNLEADVQERVWYDVGVGGGPSEFNQGNQHDNKVQPDQIASNQTPHGSRDALTWSGEALVGG